MSQQEKPLSGLWRKNPATPETAAPPILRYTTRCRVPGCNTGPSGGPQEFTSSPLDIPIIGQPSARVVGFVQGLMAHLLKHHPQQMQQIQGSIAELTGFLVVSAFQGEDPQLQALHERVRAGLHRISRRQGVTLVLTDQAIQQRISDVVHEMGLKDAEEEQRLMAGLQILLTDMRDLLLEQGQYTPQAPAPSPLVKP